MALKIVTAQQALQVQNIITVIYGDPGIGKTSLASSASRPILFDFDLGAHRAGKFRKDVVQVTKWQEVASLTADDLSGYDTIIVDTAGRMLDCITAYIVETDPKSKRGDGGLNQPGFGKLANIYKNWLNRLRLMGKDIVLIAHAKEDKKGETLIVRPDMTGSSKNELYKSADQMGYMTIDDSSGKARKLLSFTPSPGWHAKDSGALGNMALPDLDQSPDLLADLLQQIKDHINSLSETQLQAQQALQAFRDDCMEAADAEALNALVKRLDRNHPAYVEMRQALMTTAARLPVSLDKAAGAYVDNAAPAPEAAQ